MNVERQIVACLVVAGCIAVPSHAGAQPRDARQIAAELQKASDSYANQMRHYQCDETVAAVGSESSSRDQIRQNPRCGMRITSSPTAGDRSGSVFGTNPDYSFELSRRGDMAEWLLHKVERRFGPEVDPANSVFSGRADGFLRIYCPYYVVNWWTPDWLRSEGFSIRRQEPTADGLLKIEFTYSRAKDEAFVPAPVTQGYFVIAPSRSWIVTEYQTRIAGANGLTRTETTKDAFEDREGIPFRIESDFVSETTLQGRSSRMRHLKKYEYERKSLADSEFTLSAFGLPEPGGVKRGIPIYIYLGVTGVFVLLAAAFLRRRYRPS